MHSNVSFKHLNYVIIVSQLNVVRYEMRCLFSTGVFLMMRKKLATVFEKYVIDNIISLYLKRTVSCNI